MVAQKYSLVIRKIRAIGIRTTTMAYGTQAGRWVGMEAGSQMKYGWIQKFFKFTTD